MLRDTYFGMEGIENFHRSVQEAVVAPSWRRLLKARVVLEMAATGHLGCTLDTIDGVVAWLTYNFN